MVKDGVVIEAARLRLGGIGWDKSSQLSNYEPTTCKIQEGQS